MAIERNLKGVKPDTFDPQDKHFADHFTVRKTTFLTKLKAAITRKFEIVDLRKWSAPIKDQTNLGCCTGFGYSGVREELVRKHPEEELSDSVTCTEIFSPLYIYYREREMEGTLHEDSGAQMRTGCKVLAKWGVCLEAEDPYNPAKFDVTPDPSDDVAASKYRVIAYHRLTTVDEMKECLRRGYAFAIGIPVYESFERIGSNGKMPLPSEKEECLGGHAVCVVGFDDKQKCFIVRNSWGKSWGHRGYFYMPYEFISNGQWWFDAWMVTQNPAKVV